MKHILSLTATVSIISLLAACQPATMSSGPSSTVSASSAASYQAAPDELPLIPAAWTQNTQRNTSLPPRHTSDGLTFLGSGWTNGRVSGGQLDGNGFFSNSQHNFVGRTTNIEFAVNGGGKYMAINIAPQGLPAHFFSTHNSWNGSRVLPQNDKLVMALKIDNDGKWTQVVRDKSNGAIVAGQGGKVTPQQLAALRNAAFGVNFHDNHAGRNTSITLYKISGLETAEEAAKKKAAPPTQTVKELPKSLNEPMKMLEAGFEEAAVEQLQQAMMSLDRKELLRISITDFSRDITRRDVKERYKNLARLALLREAALFKAYDAAPEPEWKAALLKAQIESLFFYGLAATGYGQPGAVAQATAKQKQLLSQAVSNGVETEGLAGYAAMLTLAQGLLNGDNAAYDRYVTDTSLSGTDRDNAARLLSDKGNEFMAPALFLDRKKMDFILGKYAGSALEITGYIPNSKPFIDINGKPLQAGTQSPTNIASPATPSGSGPAPTPTLAPVQKAPVGKVLD